MKHINFRALAALAILLTVSLWLGLLFINGLQLEATWTAFKQLPTVLTIEMILWGLFVRWWWRWRAVQGWLVPFPVIEGTWRGQLQSTWNNSQTQTPSQPIALTLVVRQTFLTVSCTMFTEESESRSYSSSIHIDTETKERRLVYNYSNKPRTTIRDRSPIHDGTASLQIIGSPPKELRGEYWTNRQTKGELSLYFETRELVETFLH